MKNTQKNGMRIAAACAIALVFGLTTLSLTGCSSDDDSGPSNPVGRMIKWTASGKDYTLSLTELSSSKNMWTYILSVGIDGYSVGTVTVSDNDYSFTADPKVYTSSYSFQISIDSKANTVSTSEMQIKLTKDGSQKNGKIDAVTNASATITKITSGVDGNPFVGNWSGEGVTVKVSKNLTWSATAPKYKNSGKYAYIENDAIVYDSKGEFFGYARIVSGIMRTLTYDGGYIDFIK